MAWEKYKTTSVAATKVVVWTNIHEDGNKMAKVLVGYGDYYEGEEIGFALEPNDKSMSEKEVSDEALRNAYVTIVRGDLYNR